MDDSLQHALARLDALQAPPTLRIKRTHTSGAVPMLRRPRRLVVVSVAAGLAFLAVVSLALIRASSPESVSPQPHGGEAPIGGKRTTLQTAGPCGGPATAYSLAQAKASLPYQPLVPSDTLAALSSLTGISKCPSTEIVLQFQSGIKIYLDQNGISNPSATWQAMAADSPSDTSVGTAHGVPAALIRPTPGQANGSVSFVTSGTWVVVEGNGEFPLDALVRIANSLQPA